MHAKQCEFWSLMHATTPKESKLLYRWFFLISISAFCVCHCIHSVQQHLALYRLTCTLMPFSSFTTMISVCRMNEFIAHMEKPFTHLPMVFLSLIYTERYVYASHTIRRFIFISVAAWYYCILLWLLHGTLLCFEPKSFEPVLARWSMSKLQLIFCACSTAKKYYYIFYFTFGGKSQRLFD